MSSKILVRLPIPVSQDGCQSAWDSVSGTACLSHLSTFLPIWVKLNFCLSFPEQGILPGWHEKRSTANSFMQ